jgi:nickel/cobalt transporter (NiCoT) family protein
VSNFRTRLARLFGLLVVANVAAWAWALLAFHDRPLLLGTALLAWGFGLRHAVDADHIAAIDNATRKLMQDGQKPLSVGLFFALGHSAVVLLAVSAVAMTAVLLAGPFSQFKVVGTLASALFLLAIAAINLVILVRLWRRPGQHDLGALAWLFRPLFRLITRPWHMLPLGFLFGLGFDTATEVALLGLSASQASQGLPLLSIMVFPALFTAGMALVDAADGALMLHAYDWAFAQPRRKLFYNLTITLMSVVVAVLIAGIELLGLLNGRLGLSGRFWDTIAALNDHSGALGLAVIGAFAAIWIGAMALWRYKGLDRLEVADD